MSDPHSGGKDPATHGGRQETPPEDATADRKAAAEPGHTPAGGEGGGSMSGRGQEEGGGWQAQERDAREQAERNAPDGLPAAGQAAP